MHDPRSNASGPRFALTPVALVVACLAAPLPALAQPEPAPRLRASPLLQEQIPAETRGELPTFVEGDRIEGQTDMKTVVEGDAELRRGDTIIRARRLEYNQPTDLARATGDVRINKAGNIFEGTLLELEVDAFRGFFNEPHYRFLRNDAYGQADRVDFLDPDRAVIHNATYTTCQRQPGPSWMPDWILRARTLRLDNEEQVGQAEGAVLEFLGVPILPVPSLSFPLSDQRKSGLLPPVIGLDSKSGFEYTQPWYWNIAPNRDATFYPTLMTKRGVDLAGEFRYLEANYQGKLRANYLPDDRQRNRDRWGYAVQHDQLVPLAGQLGGVALNLNVNRVSDDNYWRDFSRTSASLTQRLLAGEGIASWGYGDFSFMARTLKWQTLQDPTAPIVPPYDRAPQLVGRFHRGLAGGVEAYVETDYTRFTSDPLLTRQPNANRAFTRASLSRPWLAPGGFFTPRVQLHATHYDFETPLANGRTTADRSLPIFSLDGGLVFERDTALFGRAFRQTLEPRAFYVYTPFRDQNFLPNYDSGFNDFNFATIWTENSFGGNDRIADNNLLTLGATTRLLDPDTGAEAARFGVAQRLRFKDQRVVLPGQEPISERLSDVLFGASVNMVPQWNLDGTVQYNPKTGQSIRTTLGATWNPGSFRVLSAAYRLQRNFSEQLDVGWQWPLDALFGGARRSPAAGCTGRWYTVGRMNFSLRERRLVDALAGFEYDAGCWIGRIVLERLQAGASDSNKRVLFQLEFVGFTRLGSNALQTLRDNIPRYQFLREQVTEPSRFSNYD